MCVDVNALGTEDGYGCDSIGEAPVGEAGGEIGYEPSTGQARGHGVCETARHAEVVYGRGGGGGIEPSANGRLHGAVVRIVVRIDEGGESEEARTKMALVVGGDEQSGIC